MCKFELECGVRMWEFDFITSLCVCVCVPEFMSVACQIMPLNAVLGHGGECVFEHMFRTM